MILHPVRRPRLFMSTIIQPPTVPGASPSTLPTSDSGSNQKPRGLWPNAHPLDHAGMYFHPKCVSTYPRTSQNLQGIEIWKIKILTPSGSEPRSAESYTVIIPLDHWFVYRNIRNEYINLIWHHLVSHINFRFWNRTRIFDWYFEKKFNKNSNTFSKSGNLY